MNRNTVLWTLVLFFGACLVFNTINRATEDESTAVSLGLQIVALVVIIVVILLISRRRSRD